MGSFLLLKSILIIFFIIQVFSVFFCHRLSCTVVQSRRISTIDNAIKIKKTWVPNIFKPETWISTSLYLSVLCEVMVQQLGVGLLVRWQDVQEGSRGVTRSSPRVQGPCTPQRWGQAEGRWCPCVKALLVKWLRREKKKKNDVKNKGQLDQVHVCRAAAIDYFGLSTLLVSPVTHRLQ